MRASKTEIREIVLDIFSGREKVIYCPNQFAHLREGVAEVLARRAGNRLTYCTIYPQLSEDETATLKRVFRDLIGEKIVELEWDDENPFFSPAS